VPSYMPYMRLVCGKWSSVCCIGHTRCLAGRMRLTPVAPVRVRTAREQRAERTYAQPEDVNPDAIDKDTRLRWRIE